MGSMAYHLRYAMSTVGPVLVRNDRATTAKQDRTLMANCGITFTRWCRFMDHLGWLHCIDITVNGDTVKVEVN